jgi:hypothetical protein
LAGHYPDEGGSRETQLILVEIIGALQFFAEEPRNPVPDSEASLVEFLKRCEPSIVKKHADPNTGLLVDCWNNPIRLIILTSHKCRLVSYGPNGNDDEGKYDDIVREFNPRRLCDVKGSSQTKDR